MSLGAIFALLDPKNMQRALTDPTYARFLQEVGRRHSGDSLFAQWALPIAATLVGGAALGGAAAASEPELLGGGEAIPENTPWVSSTTSLPGSAATQVVRLLSTPQQRPRPTSAVISRQRTSARAGQVLLQQFLISAARHRPSVSRTAAAQWSLQPWALPAQRFGGSALSPLAFLLS